MVGVVGEIGHLKVQGGEIEMLVFEEGTVAGGFAGGFLGPGAVVPVIEDAVVAWVLVDDFVIFVGFDWEAMGLEGEADLMEGELAGGWIMSSAAVGVVVCDLDLLQVFGVGDVVGHSRVMAEVGCLAAKEIGTQFWQDAEYAAHGVIVVIELKGCGSFGLADIDHHGVPELRFL